MGRTATQPQTPAAEPALNDQAIEVLGAKASELATLNAERASKAIAIAQQLGYEGSMTVGAIEDEIRFYQRRTVEAILETGKRMLVLKELTPHGEFAQRVEMLGFSYRTAARFMQAAAKTSKSANLALLSSQVKSASAFLELVTHDDDVLQGLQEMDDFDRMSASELRRVAREMEADLKAKDEVMAGKDRKINELARKAKKFDVHTDWPEELQKPVALVGAMRQEIRVKLGAMVEVCQQAMANAPQDPAEREVYDQALRALAKDMQQHVAALREEFEAMESTFLPTLGALLED